MSKTICTRDLVIMLFINSMRLALISFGSWIQDRLSEAEVVGAATGGQHEGSFGV